MVTVLLFLTAFSGSVGAASGGISRNPGGGTGSGASSSSADRYERIWLSFASSERRWANRTADCESGRNPKAIGGGGAYRGAFQFMKSTWQASPKSPGGDPIAYPYKTQAVVAVMLMRRDGPGAWPVCG
jgi:hypothetical protein